MIACKAANIKQGTHLLSVGLAIDLLIPTLLKKVVLANLLRRYSKIILPQAEVRGNR